MAKAAKTKAKATPAQQLLRIARAKAKECRTWPELHNAVYGIGAAFSELFPSQSERTAFAGTTEHKQIAELIESLPGPGDERTTDTHSGKVLVRLPSSIHAALIKEADLEGVSLNQLIVAKLAAQLRDIVRA